jgi:hypothetical protein
MFQTQLLQLSDISIPNILRTKYIDTGLVYGFPSNIDKTYDYGHWSKNVLGGSKNFVYDHADMPMIKDHPEIAAVWETLKAAIPHRGIMRVYVNGYTYGTDAYAHIDDIWIKQKFGQDALSETAVIYLNDEWHMDWAGETVIFNPEGDIESSVMPRAGRILIFDSSKFHGARPLSRSCPKLRSVLVIKTIDKRFMSKEIELILNLTKDKPELFAYLHSFILAMEKISITPEVCAAGLFHLIYKSQFDSVRDQITRDIVKECIGEYSESLAHAYAQHDVVYKNAHLYDDKFANDLLAIDYVHYWINNHAGCNALQLAEVVEEIKKRKSGSF